MKTIWINRALIVLLIGSLHIGIVTSCSSITNIENKKSMESVLREGKLVLGTQLVTYYFNDYVISGVDFVKADSTRSEEFETLLSELGIVRIEEGSSQKTNGSLARFGKRSNEAFSKKDSALYALRTRFGGSYGPLIIDNTRTSQGSLRNQLIVKCNVEVSDTEARELFEKYEVSKIHFEPGEQSYILIFPDDWGFILASVAEKMLAEDMIFYVENCSYGTSSI
jgi:hypothetical protein